MNIVLLGAPGSGKSSAAAAFALASMGEYTHISSGQIARSLAQDDDLTHAALQRGDYAPEAAMRSEIASVIEGTILTGKHVVVEGFPRMLAQVVVLEETFEQSPLYVHLACPKYICLRRAIKRGRDYDKPDAIASRFEAYERDTAPVIQMLHESNALVLLDTAAKGVQEVTVLLRSLVTP
jgi:adenylate kinase family enzyme